MPRYRRKHDGQYYFFTLVTCKRIRIFQAALARDLLRDAIRATRQHRPWVMEAMVLLPEHLHMLWRLPEDDWNYSTRIAQLKRTFTKSWTDAGGTEVAASASQRRQRYRGVWQKRFWEHCIRDARDLRMHIDYIHANPVKHELADRPRDWPWSSFGR